MLDFLDYVWAQYLATLALVVAMLLPFFGELNPWVLAALLALPTLFALTRGFPTDPPASVWLALMVLAAVIAVLSFVLTFADPLPQGLTAGLYFERRWMADVAVFGIVGLSFGAAYAHHGETQTAALQLVYRRFLQDPDVQPKMDPAELGYGAAPGEKCYFGRPEVVLGSFQEWNQEVKAEIGAQLEVAVLKPSLKLSKSPSEWSAPTLSSGRPAHC